MFKSTRVESLKNEVIDLDRRLSDSDRRFFRLRDEYRNSRLDFHQLEARVALIESRAKPLEIIIGMDTALGDDPSVGIIAVKRADGVLLVLGEFTTDGGPTSRCATCPSCRRAG